MDFSRDARWMMFDSVVVVVVVVVVSLVDAIPTLFI
jgi:hypothetical protein